MKIPKQLPQFDNIASLFISSGEYEAHFYLANNGNMDLIKIIKKSPREDAKEKQAFVGKKSGMFSRVAVSHKGAYIEDLKRKFVREVHGMINELIIDHNLKEIYLFAPKYVSERVMTSLSSSEKELIKMRFFGEHIKEKPIFMLKTFLSEIKHSTKG